MDFSTALLKLKEGKRVTRTGWNGKGMFIFLVQGSVFKVNRPPLTQFYEEGTEIQYLPHIDMKLADGRIMVWTPAQTDLISEDWLLAE